MTPTQIRNADAYKHAILIRAEVGELNVAEELIYIRNKRDAAYLLHDLNTGAYYDNIYTWLCQVINAKFLEKNIFSDN